MCIMNTKPVVGILGNGEIGSSLHKVYQMAGYTDCIIRDPFNGLHDTLENCDIVNVCIPYFGYDKFVKSIQDLGLKEGCVLIIQSTIGINTTDKFQEDLPGLVCVQSPVRGVHPNLAEGMLTFEKYIGVSEKYFVDKDMVEFIENHVKSLNIKPVVCRAKESEMAKMISTTLYGINIAAITDVANLCEEHDLDFDKVFTKWQTGYNEGYQALGKGNVCRPVLTPVPKNKDGERFIGGHCVLPNCVILSKYMGEKNLSGFVLRYANEAGKTHVTGASH